MSGSFLRNGGRIARQFLFNRHSLSPPPNLRSRYYVRSNLSSSKFKVSPSPPPSTVLPSSSSVARNGFVGWYLGMIEARPVLTKSLTAGAIFTAADVSAQMITLKPVEPFDLIRTLRMAGYGMALSGPSLHIWFNTVSRFLLKRDILTTFKKMFLGQAVYGPIMTSVFFSVNAGLQGETGAEIFARLKRDLFPTLVSQLVYWPVCDFVIFKFTSVRLQPLVNNSFSFFWTIYITYMASLQKASIEETSTDF